VVAGKLYSLIHKQKYLSFLLKSPAASIYF